MTQQPQHSTQTDSSDNTARNDDEPQTLPLPIVFEEQIINATQYNDEEQQQQDEDDYYEEDENDDVDNYIFNEIQRELDAEIEAQFQEMLDENQQEIEDELQRQIDDQLQKSMDDQMEEYYNNRAYNDKRSYAHEPSSLSIEEQFETTEIASTMSDMAFLHQNLTLLGLSDPSAPIATNRATGSSVESINAQIDGIISKYNANNNLQQEHDPNFYDDIVLDRN